MDEMTMVRHLLDEAPPSGAAVDAGRERLLRASTGATPSARPGRAIPRVMKLSATGVVVVAVIVVSLVVPGVSTGPGRGSPFVADASARDVLLAAATQAEAAPTTGTYWHVHSRSVTTLPDRFGRGANRYTMEQHVVSEAWTQRNGRSWTGSREWVRPKAATDEAAWRRDGARRAWCHRNTEVVSPRISCQRIAPGTASLRREYFAFQVGEGTELTYAQLQALPTDAEALRSWVERRTRKDLDPAATDDIVNDNVGEILVNLLVSYPVPPGVRAAAYRALAELPGVTSAGPTRDELGRAGVGITIHHRGVMLAVGPTVAGGSAGQLTRTLIIDPATSHVLADRATVGSHVVTDKLILEVGWTDEPPHEPAEA
jgi:hypothetical protein